MQDTMKIFHVNDFKFNVTGDKFELGREYIMTLDPKDSSLEDSKIDYNKAFMLVDDKDNPYYANDARLFANPIDHSEPVVCQMREQRYLKNCSVVYFMAKPMKMFLKDTFKGRLFENGMHNPNIIMKRIGEYHMVNPYGTSEYYIIADNLDLVEDIPYHDDIPEPIITIDDIVDAIEDIIEEMKDNDEDSDDDE